MAQRSFSGKMLIDAVLTVKTGMHIGGSGDFAAIGAIDSCFVRDPLTKAPMIPGSSLKGKMRTLLAKARNNDLILKDPAQDETVVARLFGISNNQDSQPARLQFTDALPDSESIDEFGVLESGSYLGEIKFENTINRGTGVANPRQIERVPAGMKFNIRLTYNIEDENELAEDMNVLAQGFRWLQLDYLGGHGSRGYGRVALTDFRVKRIDAKTGKINDEPNLVKAFDEARV